MPDLTSEQKAVLRRALAQARKDKASPREQKALVEALSVESNFRNLNYGDRDSVGALQQRTSQGWGPASESLETDVSQFLRAARSANTGGGSAGDLAQAVQRSGFPDRYQQQSGQADALLARYGGAPAGQGAKVRAPSPAQAQTTVTTPGVDNSGIRRQLVGSFLQQGGIKNSSAVLGLAAQYGQAADVPGTTTTTKVKQPSTSARASASSQKKLSGSKVLELIYNDGGKGYGIKNGQTVNGSQVFGAVWAGHKTHVHAAAGPNTIVALGKLAQSMGLHVGENEYFTGQRPAAGVHTDTSNHYREGRTKSGKPAEYAIDVSGDAAKMKQFARAVAQYNRTRTLPK